MSQESGLFVGKDKSERKVVGQVLEDAAYLHTTIMLSTQIRLIQRSFSSEFHSDYKKWLRLIQINFTQILASRPVQDGSKIGFIGLGNMGRGMAKNLLDKGHEVVAFDTSAEALKEAVGNGAKEATSPKVFTHIIDFTKPFKNMLLRFVIQWTSHSGSDLQFRGI